MLYFKRGYAASSMIAPRRLNFFCTTSNIYRYIPINSHKTLTKYIPEFSGWITLSIVETRRKIRAVVLEFIVSRQTDRRDGGLCFIICIDRCLLLIVFQQLSALNTCSRISLNDVIYIFMLPWNPHFILLLGKTQINALLSNKLIF